MGRKLCMHLVPFSFVNNRRSVQQGNEKSFKFAFSFCIIFNLIGYAWAKLKTSFALSDSSSSMIFTFSYLISYTRYTTVDEAHGEFLNFSSTVCSVRSCQCHMRFIKFWWRFFDMLWEGVLDCCLGENRRSWWSLW